MLEFLLERARYILRERRGFAYDEINAAFAAGADDLVDAVERVAALQAIRNTKNFAPLAASFKRIRNILEKSAGKGDKGQGAVRPDLLKEAAELQLYTAAQRIGEEAASRKKERKYRVALEKISELRPAVDHFFDKVLVMAEDEEVRRNRIALLGSIVKGILDDRRFLRAGRGRFEGGGSSNSSCISHAPEVPLKLWARRRNSTRN